MIGDSVIAADLSTAHLKAFLHNENSSTVMLPEGTTWYLFNTTETVAGSGAPLVRDKDLRLDEFPVYVVKGSILPIHPWDRAAQHSQAQKGLLEVQVYGGADAHFVMYEDDGMTNAYATDRDVRTTSFVWDEAQRTLKWSVAGGQKQYDKGNDYTQVRVALFELGARGVLRSKVGQIGAGGHFAM